MAYKVLIRNNETKEERWQPEDLEWSFSKDGKTHDEHGYPCGSLWWWTEGNFGCDCNREWEFQRAGGEELSEDPPCGGKKYTVIKAVLPDGREIAIDDNTDFEDEEIEKSVSEVSSLIGKALDC